MENKDIVIVSWEVWHAYEVGEGFIYWKQINSEYAGEIPDYSYKRAKDG